MRKTLGNPQTSRVNQPESVLEPLLGGNAARNLEAMAALCRATNDWQAQAFVEQEGRLRASILVPQDDAEAAVDEIERRAGDWRFAQIQLASKTTEPLGRRRYWPIFAAAQASGLSIGVHVASQGGPPSASGWPQFYIEEHHMGVHSMQNQAASLILEGVFEAFPRLKVVLIEGGLAWGPTLAWRLDHHWKKMRHEVPQVKRPPSEYMRSNIWFSTQPVEEPESPEDLRQTFEWIGWDRIIYSSDYPHWDFDDPHQAFRIRFTPEQERMIFRENALGVYGPYNFD